MARPLARRADAGLPQWIRPQLTQFVDAAPDGPDWLHEIKFDGYRIRKPAPHRLDGIVSRFRFSATDKTP
jgi:ATP-dependent DNA ligase